MNEEETARLRSYLASQSTRRTPSQLLEMLQNAYQDFKQATFALPDALFRQRSDQNEWSAAEVVEHVQAVIAVYEQAICTVIEHGTSPDPVQGAIDPLLSGASRERLLASIEQSLQHLTIVTQRDPQIHLDVTWEHFELGQMHWREWLLFARVHLIEHVRQMQELGQSEK